MFTSLKKSTMRTRITLAVVITAVVFYVGMGLPNLQLRGGVTSFITADGAWNMSVLNFLDNPASRLFKAHSLNDTLRADGVRDDFISHSQIYPETVLEDKYIVYMCSRTICGGLGDRQKGIVTSYVISQMLKRKFGIIMNKGCDHSNFLLPNIVQWKIDEDSLKGKIHNVKSYIDKTSMATEFRDGNLSANFKSEVTYYHGNIDYVGFLMKNPLIEGVAWLRNQSHFEIYRTAFWHLFKLSPNTRRRYEDYRLRIGERRSVCVHLRCGRSLTFWEEGVQTRCPNLTAVMRFLHSTLQKSDTLFIATDSEDIRNRTNATFPEQFMEIQGDIIHNDHFPRATDCGNFEKVLLDQYVLTKCDVLVISQSGFSRLAAIYRGTETDLYLAGVNNVSRTHLLEPTLGMDALLKQQYST